jgi:hypothetical protein
MIRFACTNCPGEACELRVPGAGDRGLPDCCPFGLDVDPVWLEVPTGRSTALRPGLALLPGPFCEIPATAIVAARAEGGRYAIEIGGLDRLLIPCSRAAFNEAVTAMEVVRHAAIQ